MIIGEPSPEPLRQSKEIPVKGPLKLHQVQHSGARIEEVRQGYKDRSDRSFWELLKKFQKCQEERKAEFQGTLGQI